MRRPFLSRPLALAAVVTLANAAKPVTVDDAAYLFFARHIAQHPADPYGFPIFWWADYEPAMQVLAPPVVPYWLALGVNVFGESVPLLKLWLFPFAYLLAWSLRALLVRFARGVEVFMLPLLVLSPAVLPAVNLMLDVPAVALALASVEVFIRACRRAVWREPLQRVSESGTGCWPVEAKDPLKRVTTNFPLAVLAGLLAGLAMQTKYTAFAAPAVIAWYGIAHRRVALAAVAAGLGVLLFAAWELLLVQHYGRSHFWLQASSSAGGTPREQLAEKLRLVPPLVACLGCLAAGVGLVAWSLARLPRVWLRAIVGIWWAGVALVCTLPREWTAINEHVTAANVFWNAAGYCWLLGIAFCAGVLLFRVRKGLGVRLNSGAVFLAGWLLIEIVATLALTPFPAARRVIGATLVAGLLVARLASRVRRVDAKRTPPRWAVATGIAAGFAVAALDTWDAYAEKVCAERAAEVVRDRPAGSTVWFVGHWGFQYYCEREGMKPLIAGGTVARAGDFVVLPAYPDGGFHRPYPGFTVYEPVGADEIAVVAFDDWLSARTVPDFYGGTVPVAGRDHPRLVVRVYRLGEDWVMR